VWGAIKKRKHYICMRPTKPNDDGRIDIIKLIFFLLFITILVYANTLRRTNTHIHGNIIIIIIIRVRDFSYFSCNTVWWMVMVEEYSQWNIIHLSVVKSNPKFDFAGCLVIYLIQKMHIWRIQIPNFNNINHISYLGTYLPSTTY